VTPKPREHRRADRPDDQAGGRLDSVQGEPGRNRFARRQTVRVEGERRGAAGNADVRGRERHDSGELEGRHDEQRGGERMRHAERAARERRCTDPRAQASGNRIPPPSIALQLAALHARATAKQQPERTSSPASALRTAARIACIAHIFRSPAPVPGRAAGPAPHRHRSVTREGGGAAASRRAAARRAPA
jgi:hypothetical protein